MEMEMEKDQVKETPQVENQNLRESQENLELEEENPVSKALRNPLVVKTIIRHLSCAPVLKCRLLNKLWLELGTERLTKSRDEDEDALQIRFRYCKEARTCIKNFGGILRGEIKTLESFNEFLSNLDETELFSFPCKNFEFKDLVLSRPQIQQFFQLQGSKIKGLRLDFDVYDKEAANTESFTDLLTNKAPNLECLTILKTPVRWEMAVGNEQTSSRLLNFTFDKLRCFRISISRHGQFNRRLEREIILSSPALKTVHALSKSRDIHLSDFDYLTSISKGHLITQVAMEPTAKNMEILNKFAQSQPRLSHLKLCLDFVENPNVSSNAGALDLNLDRHKISFQDFVQLSSTLLESSKESLEFFSMPKGKMATRFLKDGGIPILKNVKEVVLFCREKARKIDWPIPVKEFNRIFPNARELSLIGKRGSGGFLTLSLQENPEAETKTETKTNKSIGIETEIKTRAIPQITSLILDERFTRDFLNNIPNVFPNLVELQVCNENLLPVLPLLWNLTSLRLKVLVLEMTVDANFPALDSALTGFSEKTCAELLSKYPEILDEEIVQQMRINSSILDLKYLEELRFKFWILGADEFPENILTVVSDAYAFQQMKLRQQLQVEIEIIILPKSDYRTSTLISKTKQMENILKSMLPFARLIFTIDEE